MVMAEVQSKLMDKHVKLAESNYQSSIRAENRIKAASRAILWLGSLLALVLVVQGHDGGRVLEPTKIEHSAPRHAGLQGELTKEQGRERRGSSQNLVAIRL
jgi:hypothetical protein